MSSAISTPTADEYTAIQRFLEDVYGHGLNYFPLHYGWCWRPEHMDYAHTYCLRENGRIASLVRVFPLPLQQGAAQVKVAGIGAVSTLPAHRGKGYMKRLLEYAIAAMRREGFPVSILWGDQHRYQPFGYQTAGKMIALSVSRRGLEKTRLAPLTPARFQGQEQLFRSIFQAYQRNPFRHLRTEPQCRAAYEHARLLLYAAGEAEKFGYLGLFYGAGMTSGAVEFGGHPSTILQIAANLMERFGVGTLEFRFPKWSLIPPDFVRAASYWKVEPAGQIKILDLEATLRDFRPQAPQFSPGEMTALKALPETEQVDALFGTANNSPFNLFFWPLDHI